MVAYTLVSHRIFITNMLEMMGETTMTDYDTEVASQLKL